MTNRKTQIERLRAYLAHQHAADIAQGWALVFDHKGRPALKKCGVPLRPIDLPAHLRPVKDVDAFHKAHQAGLQSADGLALFESAAAESQSSLF